MLYKSYNKNLSVSNHGAITKHWVTSNARLFSVDPTHFSLVLYVPIPVSDIQQMVNKEQQRSVYTQYWLCFSVGLVCRQSLIMSGSRFTHVSQGAHFSIGSVIGEAVCLHGRALKRLTGVLLEIFRRGVTVTVGIVMLLSGLGFRVVGSRLVWSLTRGFAFSTFRPSSQTHTATTVTISRNTTAAKGMTTIRE